MSDVPALARLVNELQETVQDLSSEVRILRRQLERVQGRLQDAGRRGSEDERSASALASPLSQRSHPSGLESLAGSTTRSLPGGYAPTTPAASAAPLTPSSTTSATGAQTVPSWIEREAIADQIGQFVLRSLSGDNRGSSGRDLVPLASKIWLVIQDIEGNRYNPVRVFRQWTPAKALVKRQNGEVGDSIFVGLPSEREARRVVHSATLLWPDREG